MVMNLNIVTAKAREWRSPLPMLYGGMGGSGVDGEDYGTVQKIRSAQAETIDLWWLGLGFTQNSDHSPPGKPFSFSFSFFLFRSSFFSPPNPYSLH